MSAPVASVRACWCGNEHLVTFNADYARCETCETLVLRALTPARPGVVEDEAADLYGERYWFEHQAGLGLPDFHGRARQDLADRIPHWLRSLLRYRLPPAVTLELGCAHGAFVAVLTAAGFDAAGLELSAAIAARARAAFGIRVLVGPLEAQPLPEASQDVIIAMDVLEHLPDPVATLDACKRVLARNGVIVLQTPCYPEGMSFADLQQHGSPFLAMLLPGEHIYLFSQRSLNRLLTECGFAHTAFIPAVFSHYDMFAVASRIPLAEHTDAERDAALGTSVPGRLVRALLDKDAQLEIVREDLVRRLEVSEADRAARLAVIEAQGRDLGTLQAQVHTLVADLQRRLETSEAARAAEARNRARFAKSWRGRLLRQLGLIPRKPRR